MTMRWISSRDCIYAFDATMEPVCWVEPDEVFHVEMRDALDGQVREGATLKGLDGGRANPATGPIGVRGARPGQVLAVDILDIRVARQGYVTYGGVPRFFRQQTGMLQFNKALRLALHPMIGTIGVAPREGHFPNMLCGTYGGNMDVKDVCAGATIYLPVQQDGALLAMGDVHSVQADGESSGQGVETPAEATVRVRCLDEALSEGPIIFRDGTLMAIGSGETLDDACARAVEAMARIVATRSVLSADEAHILLGLVGEVRVGQMVCPLRSARVLLPIAMVPWERPPPL